jgi:hypothetical protein
MNILKIGWATKVSAIKFEVIKFVKILTDICLKIGDAFGFLLNFYSIAKRSLAKILLTNLKSSDASIILFMTQRATNLTYQSLS